MTRAVLFEYLQRNKTSNPRLLTASFGSKWKEPMQSLIDDLAIVEAADLPVMGFVFRPLRIRQGVIDPKVRQIA